MVAPVVREPEPPPPSRPGTAEPMPPPRRGGRGLKVLLGMAVLGLSALVCAGIPVALWYENPANLPPQLYGLLPPPRVLPVNDPEHAVISESLRAHQPHMTAGCGGAGPLRFEVVIEATGKVREVRKVQAQDVEAARCVVRNLRELTFARTSPRAVTLGVAMTL